MNVNFYLEYEAIPDKYKKGCTFVKGQDVVDIVGELHGQLSLKCKEIEQLNQQIKIYEYYNTPKETKT